MNIHFIYPHKRINRAPDIIGWKIFDFLCKDHQVVIYDWNDTKVIKPQKGDILMGHPHPNPFTVFNQSFKNPNWGKRIVLTPFNCDPKQNAFLDKYMYKADAYIAITGNYWREKIKESVFRHWLPKFIPLELAIDTELFPQVKTSFNPVGRRNIIYIGHTGWRKNTPYLAEIASRAPNFKFFWCGKGKQLQGFKNVGYLDFSSSNAKELISQMDFSITVGRYDANPTTILESMAWGIIPICTPSSGYNNKESIINIPLDDVDESVRILDRLNHLSNSELLLLQDENFALIKNEFNWKIFLNKISEVIETDVVCPNIEKNFKKRVYMYYNEIKSPDFFLYPINIARSIKDIYKNANSF